MPPKSPTESHTPGALEAVMADAAATAPAPSGEPVPVTVSMPAVESAPASAKPAAMPSIGGVTEPNQASTDTPAMPAPGSAFGLGEHDLEHPVLPTTAATAANPDATAAIEGSSITPAKPTMPATPPAVTPPAEPAPSPAIAVNEAGAPTGSQELGPTDKLVVNETGQKLPPYTENPHTSEPQAAPETKAAPEISPGTKAVMDMVWKSKAIRYQMMAELAKAKQDDADAQAALRALESFESNQAA